MTDIAVYLAVGLICLAGLIGSALSFSGTWLVLAAAALAWWRFPETIGPATLLVFTLLCVAAELLEALSGFLGVQRRGGSKAAGAAALFGGLAGAAIGTPLIPVLGTILGLLAGSFAGAFLTESLRLRRSRQASHIAFGALWARLAVLLLKTALTLGMSAWLLIRLVA